MLESADGQSAPTWSVAIPVHNCAHYLPHTLGEVVRQLGERPDALITVIDDDSSDDPRSVVDASGAPVRYYRTPTNLGAVRAFNYALEHSGDGRFVHLLHGDDGVLPGFYQRMEDVLERTGAVAAVCRTRYVDENGRPDGATRSYRHGTGLWDDALRSLAVSNRIRPSGIVVTRSAYRQVGPYRTDLPHAADWEMWSRLAAHGPIAFVDEILAEYRRHSASDTATRVRTGANIRERVAALTLVSQFVPTQRRPATIRRGLLYSTAFAWRTAAAQARRRDFRVAGVQLAEGARCLGAMVRQAVTTRGGSSTARTRT